MENEKFLIDEIRLRLKNTLDVCYENTAQTEVYCRCPECGDSLDKTKAHMYIAMKPPFKFYCQKCGFSGRLSLNILNRLGIYDNDLALRIAELSHTSVDLNYVQAKQVREFEVNDSENDDTVKKSLEYFNNRFGVNETIETLNKKFKCVLNPYQYLISNGIDLSKSRFDFKNSIGFCSTDNKYLVCRDTSGQQKYRYNNTLLINDENASKIYNIGSPINILSDKITLVITEGIFDAIGVYYKFYQDATDTIIAAGCGKSFLQVVETFVKKGFLNFDLIIYSDQDVNINMYKNMKIDTYLLKNLSITIFYNKLGKDCGVPAEQIDVQKIII